jgi:CheY-like chemotaxis protein
MPAKMLIAEDHADARELLAWVLEDQGFTVIATEDGLAVLHQIEAELPNLIINDIHMPNLDGIEMFKTLRGLPEVGNVPIRAPNR